MIECQSLPKGSKIRGENQFFLKHADTGNYLSADRGLEFNQNNCPRCPIIGHLEAYCFGQRNANSVWKFHSGFFFPERKDLN